MNWDAYFHQVCYAVSLKSPCLSRRIGAILVRDHSIVSTGYNGPPRGVPHCGLDRLEKDANLSFLPKIKEFSQIYSSEDIDKICPRRILGFESGKGMEWCTAQHAEENAVSNAARIGASTIGTTLYMNSIIPCQKCMGTLINAGVEQIVVENATFYDKHTEFLFTFSNIKLREFKL